MMQGAINELGYAQKRLLQIIPLCGILVGVTKDESKTIFASFQQLISKLARVPKAEIDKLEADRPKKQKPKHKDA